MSTVILTGGNHIITPNSPRNSNHEILRYKEDGASWIPGI